jgi:hypothetical protein
MSKRNEFCDICGSSVNTDRYHSEFCICKDCLKEKKDVIVKGAIGVYICDSNAMLVNNPRYVDWKQFNLEKRLGVVKEENFTIRETSRLHKIKSYVKAIQFKKDYDFALNHIRTKNDVPTL